jgi:hypothetical protein
MIKNNKIAETTSFVLFEIEKERVTTPKGEDIYFEPSKEVPGISVKDQRRVLRKLEAEKVIIIRREKQQLGMMKMMADLYNLEPVGYFLTILEPKFNKTYKKYEQKQHIDKSLIFATLNKENSLKRAENILDSTNKKQKRENNIPKKFRLTIKDRKIFINDYIIGNPQYHAKGFELLRYISEQAKKGNRTIKRADLPDSFGNISLKEKIRGTSFTKLLNELGFKGEILKSFFPERSKNIIVYRGDIIHLKELKESGININVLLKELELANEKKNA